ncbi:GDYXXLXY domain-containing protein [Aquamicrobium segne]|uniref:GDYXXLXY domain-containing protein n=1 Tax=Aquamicrobium segne TaxID=469547 RepID=A0ABW0GWE8_9HYPH
MRSGQKLVWAALFLALLQAGFLGWMIVSRAAVLRDGREVVLKVEPIDPRDLLRGDYVILNYDISWIPLAMIVDQDELRSRMDGPGKMTVRLGQNADGYWQAKNAWIGNAPSSAPGKDEVDIVGRFSALNRLYSREVRVTYGIERYYLPEGEGRAIERDMRIRDFSVRVAVAASGQAQIKALMDEGKVLFEEPLY